MISLFTFNKLLKYIQNKKMAKCYQCSKSALFLAGEKQNIPLCLDCYEKFQNILEAQRIAFMQEVNYLADMIDMSSGLYGFTPRYKIPPPIVNQRQITMNNIKVDRSVIGVINTGRVEQIDVAIDYIKQLLERLFN